MSCRLRVVLVGIIQGTFCPDIFMGRSRFLIVIFQKTAGHGRQEAGFSRSCKTVLLPKKNLLSVLQPVVWRVLGDPMRFEPVDEFGNETIAGIILGGSLLVPGLLLDLAWLLV